MNDDAILLIELSGARVVGADADGLSIAAGNSTVRGLAIGGFVNGPTAGAAAIALNTNGDNLIEGDFIGTDASGKIGDGNATGVDIIGGTGNTIGGTSAAARNVISANQGSGVRVDLFVASGTLVQGNSIGTDATARTLLGNGVAGVDLAGSSVMVSRNVISGNAQNGVVANDSEAIFGNRIVSNGNPQLAGGAFGAGIKVYGSNNTIGGTGAFQSNVISSNAADGVAIISVNAGVTGNENVVQGNDIGTEPGTVYNDEGNGGDGVSIETTGEGSGGINNVIGDTPGAAITGDGNVIAFNGRNGVSVYSDIGADNTGNAVLGNSIFENKLLGIDLGNDGVTPNGSHAGESGPNGWQATPIITSAIVDNNVDGASVVIAGPLDSLANTTYRIDVLQDVAADEATFREYSNFLGMRTVTTDATGHASFSDEFFSRGPGVFTATATDPTGNTSEFSAPAQPAAPSADLRLSIGPVTPGVGLTKLPYSYVVTVTNAGPQAATNVVVKDLVGNGALLFGVDTTGTISEISPTLENISFGKLAVGASETLKFSDLAVQAGAFTDTVSVSADQADPNLANNMANVTETVIAQSADLRLLISPVTPSPGLTNLPYSYVVTVTNTGPQDATNVVVKDLVGNGAVLFGVDTTGTISEVSPTLDNISFAKLAAGASETLTFSDVAVKPGTFTDTVSVSADQADPNLANNMANVTEAVIAQTADLRLSIGTVTPTPGLIKLPYSYTVTITNAGPQVATNVFVQDIVANGALIFAVNTTGKISELSPTHDNISFPTLAVGATETFTFSDVALQPGTFTDTVSVSADQSDPNLANNMANVTETVTAQSAAPINVYGSLRDTGNGTFAPFLTWGIPLGSTDPSMFVIYRSTVPGGEGTVAYASTSGAHDFIDSVGKRGTTYYFEVTEVVGGVEGLRSKEASVTIPGIVKTSRGRVPAGPAKRRLKLHPGAGLKKGESTAPLHPSKSQKAHGPSVLRFGRRVRPDIFRTRA